jgi:hypothetical protein
MKLKCPKCGKPVFVLCLTSCPAKYECECQSKDFGLHYYDREDSTLQITQKELDAYYKTLI